MKMYYKVHVVIHEIISSIQPTHTFAFLCSLTYTNIGNKHIEIYCNQIIAKSNRNFSVLVIDSRKTF